MGERAGASGRTNRQTSAGGQGLEGGCLLLINGLTSGHGAVGRIVTLSKFSFANTAMPIDFNGWKAGSLKPAFCKVILPIILEGHLISCLNTF
jgi:hypothetical protein